MSNHTITYTTPDGGEDQIPAVYDVCQRCRGEGSHTNPAIDGHGIGQEEMDELGPEFFDDYMGGVYDIACEECKGLRVVLVADESRATPEQLHEYEQHLNALADYAAEREMERRMGA